MRLKKEIKDGKNADRAQVKPVRPMGNHLFTPHGPRYHYREDEKQSDNPFSQETEE